MTGRVSLKASFGRQQPGHVSILEVLMVQRTVAAVALRDTLLFGFDKSAALTANLVVGTLAIALALIRLCIPSRP